MMSYEQQAARTSAEIATRVTPAADGSFCVFGVFAQEELAGFLAFIRTQREELRHCAELAGTYVAPRFRRRGFGRAVVNAVVAHARSLDGVRQLKLGVNATNTPALLLYRSVGFRRFGVEPDALCVEGTYYDEELYVLRLKQGA
jgi:ribosomal protein S18 acetylase RimI-like enzyme